MKNAEYWENRFKQLEEAQHKLIQSDFSEIEKQYAQTQQILDGQIALWYQRFADNNKITLAQAKQYVQGNALNELKWNVHEYIQHGKENAVSGNWKKELENASAKFHITKLEALKIQTQQSLETLFAGVQGTVKNGVSNVYKSGYYHTAFELQKGFGVGFDISSIDQSQLEKIISKPWSPDKYNFSERIWGYKNQLISTVHNILSENIRLGGDPQKAIDKLSLAMNASKQNAGRLVMTEGAYFSSLSQHDCYEKLGVEKYEIVATLDDRTSETCISLDGKVYNITEFQAGATAPPFHCYCRTTTVPYLDYDLKLGERGARDGDGKTYYIPEDMNYKTWEKAFVNGDKSKFDLKVIEGTEHYSYSKNTNNSSESVDKSGESGIIGVEGANNMTIHSIQKPIENPIEQQHTGKGNPNAIITFGTTLNNRQFKLLDKLPDYDSRVTVHKKSVNMADLSALTAQTGHEFAMFTKGNERLIIRGNSTMVNISVDDAKQLAKEGYRWSGHTHPGVSINTMIPSAGDKAILNCFKQQISVIYNSKGNFRTFEKE